MNCTYRIHMNVSHQLKKIGVFLDQKCSVAPFEKVAGTLHSNIHASRVVSSNMHEYGAHIAEQHQLLSTPKWTGPLWKRRYSSVRFLEGSRERNRPVRGAWVCVAWDRITFLGSD